jgi:hypothetical protein
VTAASITVFDRALARRAVAIGAVAAALTTVVVVTTDEGGSWARRIGMLAGLTPIAAGLGSFAASRIAAARGELRALAAVGVAPIRARRGAVLGGVLLGLAGPVVLSSRAADLDALFPRPPATRGMIVEGSTVRAPALGLVVGPGGDMRVDGAIEQAPPPAARALPPGTGFSAALSLGIAAVGCPALASSPGRARRLAVVGGLALLLSIVAFQAVAAGAVAPVFLVPAPLILLIDAVVARYREGREP